MMINDNPFETISPEIMNAVNSCSRFYLRNVILQILIQHPALSDEMQAVLNNALENQNNDKVNKLLADAHLPGYPEHYRLSSFNPDCLAEEDRVRFDELTKLSFLKNDKKPNILLYGLPDQGRDKIAIGLGDECCRAQKSVIFISYSSFAEIMRTHGTQARQNKVYDDMLKVNCLIIDDFAGTRIYDEELLDTITQFIEARTHIHRQTFIDHKHNSKKPFVPCSTIVTSSFEPVEWVKYMDQHEKKTYNLARFFYQSYATIIKVDETNTPAEGHTLITFTSDNKEDAAAIQKIQ